MLVILQQYLIAHYQLLNRILFLLRLENSHHSIHILINRPPHQLSHPNTAEFLSPSTDGYSKVLLKIQVVKNLSKTHRKFRCKFTHYFVYPFQAEFSLKHKTFCSKIIAKVCTFMSKIPGFNRCVQISK